MATATFGLVSCPVTGQELPKRQLTPDDYRLWGTMRLDGVSGRGNWVSYTMMHDSGNDTVFIKNVKTKIAFAFPKGIAGSFGGEHTFAFMQGDTLRLINLQDGTRREIPGITQFDFSANGDWLVAAQAGQGKSCLCIYDRSGKLCHTLPNVEMHRWNNQKTALIYVTGIKGKFEVGIVKFSKDVEEYPVMESPDRIASLVWDKAGSAVSFYGFPGDGEHGGMVHFFRLREKKLVTLKSQTGIVKVDTMQRMTMKISDDTRKVFFAASVEMPREEADSASVEIWRTGDKLLASARKINNAQDGCGVLYAWWPDTGKTMQLTNPEESEIAFNGNQTHALLSDPDAYQAPYKWISDKDYTLLDLETGGRHSFLSRHSGWNGEVAPSPDGKYITYFRNGDWWVYGIHSGKNTKISSGVATQWDSAGYDNSGEIHPFGNSGWTADGKYGLYYDFYDIWAISPDAKSRRRLTTGREKGIRFRFPQIPGYRVTSNYSGPSMPVFDPSKTYVLEAEKLDTGASGYYSLDFAKGEKAIVLKDARVSDLSIPGQPGKFFYTEQSFDLPPRIVVNEAGKDMVVAESNRQHYKYSWGSSELLDYVDGVGNRLKAALFYPAGYIPGKKYPMIVYIYSRVSGGLHDYVNPSLANPTGFNVSNLTSNGYVVLMPDVAYVQGDTGISAARCVTAAVKKVIDLGIAHEKRIGLFGHSFGGYEANFIITQTGMFAAAASGSSVSDIVGDYLSLATHRAISNAFKYETQQYRFGKSFYDDRGAYHRNSPIEHVADITTPLLSWAGSNDKNVPARQLMELHLAMRRLGKMNIMLVYPNDGHILRDNDNQADLTRRLEQWFGHYLKDEPVSQWMLSGPKQ